MDTQSIFGLQTDEFDGIPIAAVVVLKVLEDDGGQAYLIRSTDGLMTVEALGMVEYASAFFKHAIVQSSDEG